MRYYLNYRSHGLYDPVVEDPEAPFEQYEQPDSDQPSEPTEVFKLEKFEPSPAPTLDPTPELQPSSVGPDSRGPTPFVPTPLEFDRSSTVSPYKFRPFSTEPLPEIPPLEDPILLSPSYQDKFNKSVEEEEEDIPVETRFKLPVSEQYDPEGKKQIVQKKDDIIERKVIKEVSEDVLHGIKEKEKQERERRKQIKKEKKKVTQLKGDKIENARIPSILELAKEEKIKHEAKKFMEEVLQEIESKKMEETTLNVVEESLQKTISVAEHITKEMVEENIIKTSKVEEKKQRESKEPIETNDESVVDDENIYSENSFVRQEAKILKDSVEKKKYPAQVTLKENEMNDKESAISELVDKTKKCKVTFDIKDTTDNQKFDVLKNSPSGKGFIGEEINKKNNAEDPNGLIDKMADEIFNDKIPIVSFEEQSNNSYEKKLREDKIYSSVLEDIQEEKEDTTSDEFIEEDITLEGLTADEIKEEKITQKIEKQEEIYDAHGIINPKVGQESVKNSDEISIKNIHDENFKEHFVKRESKLEFEQEIYGSNLEENTSNLLQKNKKENAATPPKEIIQKLRNEKVEDRQDIQIYENEINNDKYAHTVNDTESIATKDGNSQHELSFEETEEFEIIESTIEDQSRVKKEEIFKSYDKEEVDKSSKISEVIDKTVNEKEKSYENISQPNITKTFEKKEYDSVNVKKESIAETQQKPIRQKIYQESKEAKQNVYKSDFKTESERKMYTLGLQTIPNIKGVVQLSHFDLLLKTFFIHLTDVMVALSRFILTEPATSKPKDAESVERSIMEKTIKVEQEKQDREVIEDRIQKEVDRRVEQKLQEEAYEREEMKRAEMRVAEERQKKELEQKRQQEMKRMKEVVKEELREDKTIESETRQEARSFKSVNFNKPGRQTYRAIVEAHVYTNPDVIFEDHSSEMTDMEIEERERLESKRREQERLEIIRKEEEIRLETERKEHERIEMQRREQEKLEMQRKEQKNIEMQRREQQRRELESIEMQRREQQRREIERQEMRRSEQERMEIQRREQQKREQESLEIQKREQERMEILRREQQRREIERMDTQKRGQEKLQLHRLERQKQEIQKIEKEHTEMKKREEQILEMRRREQPAKSFGKHFYSRSDLLHEAVQKVEEFIENKRLLEEAIILQESNRTAIQYKKQVNKPVPQTFKAIVTPLQRHVTQKEIIKPVAQRTEVNHLMHKTFDVKKHTEITLKPKFVQEKVVQLSPTPTTKQDYGLKISKRDAVEVIKSLVDQKTAFEVLQVDSTRNEVRNLHVQKQKMFDAPKSIIEQRGAVKVKEIESTRNELPKLNIQTQKTFNASRSIIEQRGAIKVSSILPSRNVVADLKTTKQEAKEVVQTLVNQRAALEVSEISRFKNEVKELQVKTQPRYDAPRPVIRQHEAVKVTQIDSNKSEVTELKTSKQKAKEVVQSLVDQKAALEVIQVESTKDETASFRTTRQKVVDATQKIIEHTGSIQVAEVKSTKHVIKDLKAPVLKPVAVSQSLVEEKAIQVSEVKSSKDEVSELKVTKEKALDVSKKIIEQRAALQVAEIKSTKHDIRELQTCIPKPVEISQSLVEQTAVQVSEIKTCKDELSELKVAKEKPVDASRKITEQRAALQVAEVKSTKHEIKSLETSIPKPVAVSQSLVEHTAVEVSEVKSTKDEVSELKLTKEEAVDASKKIIEQRAALQIAEVKSTKHELKALQIPKAKPVEVSQSLIEQTAIQVVEVKSTEDEITDLEIIKQKATDASESLIEHTAVVQVAEVETARDDIAELKINHEKAVDALQTITEQTAALQIEEVEASNEEIEDLIIVKEKSEQGSLSLIDQTAALQVAKVESTKDEIADLEIIMEKAVDASKSIIEQRAALEVMKVQAEVDELSQLEVEETKSIDIKTSLTEPRNTAIVIEEVETIKDDLSDLKVQEAREALAKSSEVIVKMDKAVKGKKIPTILDEFAELKVVKYDVQEPDEIIHVTGEHDSAVQITEVSVASDREVKELSMSEQNIHIANSLEIEKSRAAIISEHNVLLPQATELEQKHSVTEFNVQASKDESASLKMIKHQVLEVDQADQMTVETEERYSSKEIGQSNEMQQHLSIQEASFTAKLAQTQEMIQSETSSLKSEPSTPSTQPPTPLTDEYVFRLEIPLPKSRGTTPVPPEPQVVKKQVVKREDPNIVKKGLIPHIEAIIEPPIVYDPPLPTPPASPDSTPSSPKYVKPGLRGGFEYSRHRREEIREMKRKSSLLASAIDETIKSIEEYKEEVGIDTKKHETEETRITMAKEQKSNIIKNGDTKDVKVETTEEIETIEAVNNNEGAEFKHGEEVTIDIHDHQVDEKINKVNGDAVNEEKNKEKVMQNAIREENIPIIKEQNGESEEEKTSKEDSEQAEISEIHEEKVVVTETTEVKSTCETKPKDNITTVKAENTETETESEESNKVETSDKGVDKEIEEIVKDADRTETVSGENVQEDVKKESEKHEKVEKEEKSKEKEVKVEALTEQKKESEIRSESVEITKTEFAKKLGKDENVNYLELIKPVKFDPEASRSQRSTPVPSVQEPESTGGRDSKMYVTETGEPLGTIQGIVDGLEEAVVDEEVAKALGKPGLPHETVAEIASGEADMLREAHVMGLSRVITSHMHRIDEDTDGVQPLKPLVKSLENSEVLRALNEELAMEELKKKKDEKRWTTFLQKPKRPVPRAKFGYYGYIEGEVKEVEEPYKVKIVKQPKPKVAPDFKPEDFDTGPLPWEQRAEIEASLPPIEPEEPILVPEEGPQFLEAIDPLPESEVPDLEDTGLPLPVFEPPPVPEIQLQEVVLPEEVAQIPSTEPEEVLEEPPQTMNIGMYENQLAEQLTRSVQSMVDPNAPLEHQLAQMRAQLAALAQLPGVIQQTLDLVTRQLLNFTYQGMQQKQMEEQRIETQTYERYEESQIQPPIENQQEEQGIENQPQENIEPPWEQNHVNQEEMPQPEKILSPEEYETLRREEEARLEEERKSEKQRKDFMQQYENESRRSQMSTPRPNKPKPKFGPLDPEERRKVVPAGRRWRTYDEQAIAETIQAQSELIQGKVLGINFMKYEKPEPTLDHLKNSEVYKVVHNMDETPLKRVELLTPVIAESDYRKRCRSRTPSSRLEERMSFPQQLHP